MSKKKSLLFPLLIPILAIFCGLPIGFGDRAPCDEEIDQKAYEQLILSNPTIARLNSSLKLASVQAGYCFYHGIVSNSLFYRLPSEWSSLGVAYVGLISLAYFKDGHFETVEQYTSERHDLEYDRVIETFKNKIKAVESNPHPRVKEFIQKIQPTEGSLITGYLSRQTQNGLWFIQYSFDPTRESWEYLLPNALEWQEFPEIKASHRIVEEHLPAINSIGCFIPQEDHSSYTGGKQYGPENPAWFMTVPLRCAENLRAATLKINPDGSFERLAITWQNTTK